MNLTSDILKVRLIHHGTTLKICLPVKVKGGGEGEWGNGDTKLIGLQGGRLAFLLSDIKHLLVNQFAR